MYNNVCTKPENTKNQLSNKSQLRLFDKIEIT